MNLHYRIGLRAIKSSLAVFVVLLIFFLLDRDNVFYATIAAVVCMQTSYQKTVRSGVNRLVGTVVGGVLGFLILQLCLGVEAFYHWAYLLIIPFALLPAIYICVVTEHKEAVTICCVVLLSIVTDFSTDISNAVLYVSQRVIDTGIGIVVATLIDRLIQPRRD